MKQPSSNAPGKSQTRFAKTSNPRRLTKTQGLNETWSIDHGIFEISEERMRAAVVVEECSGHVVGWSMGERAGTSSVQEALQFALRHKGTGIPAVIMFDNGQAFCAEHLQALLRELNLHQDLSAPHKGRSEKHRRKG